MDRLSQRGVRDVAAEHDLLVAAYRPLGGGRGVLDDPCLADVAHAHGRTPAVGLKPQIVLTGPEGIRRTFPARPTSRAGVYRTTVTFPAAGR